MKTQEIRETFLDFFSGKDHKIVESASLLPKDDPTLLFTNAGMNQFKNVFLGLEKRSYVRAASVQKCMRVSGKHNDLETVGKTSKHHTFFEMLGNFSFGDYFKQDAILFAWELMTEVFKLPEIRLYATVYKDDDEAFSIWNNEVGLAQDRIFRLGKEDNYWSMGETGPCGPCSEIHYDMGPEFGEGRPEELIRSGHDRFVELWNLVFMQFNQDKEGRIEPLPSPSVDTGMGLERMAAVLQGRISNFETDVFSPITAAISDRLGREMPFEDEDSRVAVRIIADHIRAAAFLIGDGIMPANEGRGYVLRRIIRRAFRAGNSLGLENPFLFGLIAVVCDIMKDAYPELLTSAEYIANVCKSEEQRFAATLSSGLRVFQQYVAEIKTQKKNVVPGDVAFKLYDTFGFPLDLTRELSDEEGLRVDEENFQKELEQQRKRARESWKGEDLQQELKVYEPLRLLDMSFTGYEQDRVLETCVLELMLNRRRVDELVEGDTGEVFLQETPFYAESGGQVGDTGVLKNAHFSGLVENTWAPIPGIFAHKVRVLSGRLKRGDVVDADVNHPQRQAVRKNHTATHLLHASLRRILGDHVKQAGSLVSPGRLRFDFTHFSGLSTSERHGIEALVNRKIQEAIPVRTEVMSLDQAVASGAMAIFEEKYREQVRVVVIYGFSRELCGGVHARNTGEIGLFKITSESSVAAGMRRIEAVTGEAALDYVQSDEDLLEDLQDSLSTPRAELLSQVDRLKKALKDSEKEAKSLRQKMLNRDFKQDTEDQREINGISVLTKQVDALQMSELRDLADVLKQRLGSGLVVLGTQAEGKALLVAAVTKDLLDTVKADQIIRTISPFIKGGGGGRPDFAQAGGSDPKGLKKALEKTFDALENITSKGD